MGNEILETLKITDEQRNEGSSLTEEQHAAIRDSVNWDGEENKDGDQNPPENTPPAKTPEEEKAEADAKAQVEKLAAEQGKTVEQVQKELAEAEKVRKDTEEANAKEQARLDKLAKEQNKTVDQIKADEKAAAEKAELARLEAIAKEEGLTVEEVRENEKKDQAILERHANDPKKLARAMRKEQSEYGKLKSQLDDINEEKKQQQKIVDEQNFIKTIEGKREQIIEKYRELYPHDAIDQSDDVIFDRAKGLLRATYEKAIEDQKKAVKTEADNRRKNMVENLPQEFSELKAEVKEMLDQCDDSQVLSKKFDPLFLANVARGKKFTPEYVKQLTDAAYKRGLEQPRILGATNLGRTTPPVTPPKPAATLTSEEKERAREMFSNKGWTEEKMFQEYEKNHKGKDF
jgi:hypothetical protein